MRAARSATPETVEVVLRFRLRLRATVLVVDETPEVVKVVQPDAPFEVVNASAGAT